MKEVFIVGEIQCLEGKEVEVEAILTVLRDNSKQEPGCVYYQFFESEEHPCVFATIEHWQNAEAEQQHWKTLHIQEATSQLAPLLTREMKLSRYQRAGDELGCV